MVSGRCGARPGRDAHLSIRTGSQFFQSVVLTKCYSSSFVTIVLKC